MAKAKPTAVKISGKIGDRVYVDSQKYGYHSRKAAETGKENQGAAFIEQRNRTKLLNKLAAELNTIARIYSGSFKSPGFYQNLLKRLRKEPLDNRFLLLLQLREMDINTYYPFNKLGACKTIVKEQKNKIAVELKITCHPEEGKYNANCYCYEVILLSWTKDNEKVLHARQFSDWIKLKGDHPEFEFLFPKTANTQHWLLCLRQRLGVNENELEYFVNESMQITDAGTFDKKDMDLLNKRKLAKEERNKSVKKTAKQVVRVKAKQ
jgi:hypothetical protein